MEERPSYYSILPSTVRYDKKLKANEKILYSEITVLCNKNGYCYASNEYFSNLYNVHKNTISLWINNLKSRGYIGTKIIYKSDNKTVDKRIIFLSEIILKEIAENYCEKHKEGINEIIDRYIQNHLDPINENIEENNTSINNNSTTTNTEKNIFEIIEENFGRTLNSIEYETISKWSEYNFPFDLLKHAVEKAVLKNIYAIGYIDKILYEWDKNNIRTVAQAQKDDEKYSSKKTTYKHYKTQREREEEAIANFLSDEND